MARLTVTINSAAAAFATPAEAAAEFERLLRKVATLTEHGTEAGVLVDANGNRCGHWSADYGEEEEP